MLSRSSQRRQRPPFLLATPPDGTGTIAAALTCAARLTRPPTMSKAAASQHEPVAAATASPPLDSGAILVLGDAPGFVQLVATHPQLRGRVVDGSSSGALGHTQFDRACASHSTVGPSGGGGGAYGEVASGAQGGSYEQVTESLARARLAVRHPAEKGPRGPGAERARVNLLSREIKELEVCGRPAPPLVSPLCSRGC